MSVQINVYAPHSGDVTVEESIEYTIMGDKDGIKEALMAAVRKIARVYEIDIRIG